MLIPAELKGTYEELIDDEQGWQYMNAAHEAGHAVACILLKRWFSYVTIKPRNSREASGEIVSNYTAILSFDDLVKGRKKVDHKREIQMNMAGDIAMVLLLMRYLGEDVPLKSINNYNSIITNKNGNQSGLSKGYTDQENIQWYQKINKLSDDEIIELQRKTFDLIADNMDEVLLVTNALLKHKKLKYYQVRKIVLGGLQAFFFSDEYALECALTMEVDNGNKKNR